MSARSKKRCLTPYFTSWLLLLAVGCATSAETPPPPPQGVPTRVRVLDEGFVEFEGKRMAVEFFYLEMRERVRAHWGQPAKLPWVIVEIPGEVRLDGRWLSDMREEMYKAGVPRLTVGEP